MATADELKMFHDATEVAAKADATLNDTASTVAQLAQAMATRLAGHPDRPGLARQLRARAALATGDSDAETKQAAAALRAVAKAIDPDGEPVPRAVALLVEACRGLESAAIALERTKP